MEKPSKPPSVQRGREVLKSRIKRLDSEIAALISERDALAAVLEVISSTEERIESGVRPNRQRIPHGSVRDYVIMKTRQLLREEGGPLHIHEIHARFVNRGFEVPGAGQPVNITAHIRHDEKIGSPSKGIYDLKVGN